MAIQTQEWFALRRKGIGGSDCAAALGLSKWKTQLQLYKEKRGEIAEEDISDKPHVYWGTMIEPVVVAEYCRRFNVKVEKRAIVRSRKRRWMLANVDRHVVPFKVHRRIVEAKTVNSFAFNPKDWGKDGSDHVPVEYFLQAQHNMEVSGADVCDMPVLIGGNDFRCFTIVRDQELIERICTHESLFWMAVQNGTEPKPVSEADLLLKYPSHVAGKVVEASMSVVKAHRAHERRVHQIERLTEQNAATRLVMEQAMGDAEVLKLNDVTLVTWRADARGTRKFSFKCIDDKAAEPAIEQPDAQATSSTRKRVRDALGVKE